MDDMSSSASPHIFPIGMFSAYVRRIQQANPHSSPLPGEVVYRCYKFYNLSNSPRLLSPQRDPFANHLALKPLSNGQCYMMALPTELRKIIFEPEMLARNLVIKPTCSPKRRSGGNLRPPPLKNRTSDFMILNKKLYGEIKLWAYEERFFEIHVHEGFITGGIEFLDAGRQPLMYQTSKCDDRFARFSADDEHGFHNLKKINIAIYPTAVENSHHRALGTHFMVQALVRLLKRKDTKDLHRITSLTIIFQSADRSTAKERDGGRVIMPGESYWWEPYLRKPRSTSIYGISDVELVLQPFAQLTRVHNVQIILPDSMADHEASAQFRDDLISSMTSAIRTLPTDDDLEHKIEVLRSQLEEYIFMQKYGNKHRAIGELTADEADEGQQDESKESPKHGRNASPESGEDIRRQKVMKYDEEDYWDELGGAITLEEWEEHRAAAELHFQGLGGAQRDSGAGLSLRSGRTLGSVTPRVGAKEAEPRKHLREARRGFLQNLSRSAGSVVPTRPASQGDATLRCTSWISRTTFAEALPVSSTTCQSTGTHVEEHTSLSLNAEASEDMSEARMLSNETDRNRM